ncbi:MAG: alpha-D-ribose 1-methylphosphonate 5-triphosphate diphosphatase, partial [Candidatus Accumulibacter sp.]|nr:alpha-D-ribose 1-methylphosphonate 5-triphosphate diphosphatase [Accumulibacter sp.]
SLSAAITHDAQLVSSGITTVFDAVSIGDIDPRETRPRLVQLSPMLEALRHAEENRLLRADHRLHLRCEVVHPETLEVFERLSVHPRLSLVSIMDHSPGQRQYADLEQYRIYYKGKYSLNDAEMEAAMRRQLENACLHSRRQRRAIAARCAERGLPLASHDDATRAHVEESAALGTAIAEFPTTQEAASVSHRKGLKVMMGAPNIVRGGSHSGNVSASALARAGVLDMLSSDYYPSSLLEAALALAGMEGYSLPKAVNAVSQVPAQTVGLSDRGEIKLGLRADLIQVRLHRGHPLIRQVWRQGERVF